MARCRCDPISIAACQCTVADTNCIDMSGLGTAASPFTAQFKLDSDPDNLAECGTGGFAAFLPSYLSNTPACLLHRSAVMTLPNGTPQAIEFNEERYDTDSMHSDSDLGRITFNTAGVYLVTFQMSWRPKPSSGGRVAQIWLNNSDIIANSAFAGVSQVGIGFQDGHSLGVERDFQANDFVIAVVEQWTGGDLGIELTSYSPLFGASFIRPLPEGS